MKIKKLFEIPVSSFCIEHRIGMENGIGMEYGIKMEIKGLDFTIIIKYFDKKNKVLKIHFDRVQCYKYTHDRELYDTQEEDFCDAFDTLFEIEDSEWLNELKELNEEEFNLWKLKHYVIYLNNFPVCQVIASGYDIIEEE